ncbi:hypothetical protein D3C86_2048410 [compost metagenome]
MRPKSGQTLDCNIHVLDQCAFGDLQLKLSGLYLEFLQQFLHSTSKGWVSQLDRREVDRDMPNRDLRVCAPANKLLQGFAQHPQAQIENEP